MQQTRARLLYALVNNVVTRKQPLRVFLGGTLSFYQSLELLVEATLVDCNVSLPQSKTGFMALMCLERLR